MDDERRKIRNKYIMSQVIDLTGLSYGSITPTDIDGFIDFGNDASVILEYKHKNASPCYGQKLAIERLADDIEKTGKKSLVIYAEHETPEEENIPAAECFMTQIRFEKKWYTYDKKYTVKYVIDKFLRKYLPRYVTTLTKVKYEITNN